MDRLRADGSDDHDRVGGLVSAVDSLAADEENSMTEERGR
jgi:hypothetical protein